MNTEVELGKERQSWRRNGKCKDLGMSAFPVPGNRRKFTKSGVGCEENG